MLAVGLPPASVRQKMAMVRLPKARPAGGRLLFFVQNVVFFPMAIDSGFLDGKRGERCPWFPLSCIARWGKHTNPASKKSSRYVYACGH